ncbi:MAG: 4Fe-4S dicluster domain-containing protein [Methanomassiliicoccales archaeon]
MDEAEFRDRVAELSGEELRSCYQCGKCSASCPMADFMDLYPREVLRRILDNREDVLESETPWICATCFSCTARCPNEIDIARVMEALRQMRLRAGRDRVDPSSLPPEELEELPQIALIGCFRKMTG